MASVADAVRVRESATLWKWSLLALCGVAALWITVSLIDLLGLGGPPWYGWWDATWAASGTPYTLVFEQPLTGGASARAGIVRGDRIDLRDQSLGVRLRLFVQPLAERRFDLTVRTEGRAHAVYLYPGTFWGRSPFIKVSQLIAQLAYSLWFLGCAMLIAFRRAELPEGRTLTLVLLAIAVTWCQVSVPDDGATVLLFIAPPMLNFVALWLLVRLTSQFGSHTRLRQTLEVGAYTVIALNIIEWIVFLYGLISLRFDPLPFGVGGMGAGVVTVVLTAATFVSVVAVAAAAVFASPRQDRPRTAWLLLPLPVALAAVAVTTLLQNLTQGWIEFEILYLAGSLFYFVGALALTYAVLNRRVLDFEFVLSRTIVVATISLIVVVAFVLLEWALGIFVTDASHPAGVVANAALALVLGLLMRFIHKRVDDLVDSALMSKRREDERALLDFSKEAAYVTDRDALLDQTLAKLERHTDARSASLMLDGAGSYAAVRSFGDGVEPKLSENDAAVLAFKTWHKALDPHKYNTALRGDVAFPMLARGHLLGILVLGERKGGEAYTPDEVEALSQFTDGIGSALDRFSDHSGESLASLRQSLAAAISGAAASMNDTLRALPDAIAKRLHTEDESG